MSKKKPEPALIAYDGSEIHRRFRTEYWFDGRLKKPSPWTRGFPKAEDGSIEGAGRVVMKGHAAKIKCFDRVSGKYLWSVVRGERVEGTHLYQPQCMKGDCDSKPRAHKEKR